MIPARSGPFGLSRPIGPPPLGPSRPQPFINMNRPMPLVQPADQNNSDNNVHDDNDKAPYRPRGVTIAIWVTVILCLAGIGVTAYLVVTQSYFVLGTQSNKVQAKISL